MRPIQIQAEGMPRQEGYLEIQGRMDNTESKYAITQ